jgi:hypothetical protein
MTTAWMRVVEMRESRGDLEPGVRTALARLGYRLISAEEAKQTPPAVRVVNASGLARVPDDPTPIILIATDETRVKEDTRITGVLPRPADLVGLYQLLQRTLEQYPREYPRIATTLSARCLEGDRNWLGAIVELSEKGCLLRSPTAPQSSGAQLTFALPERGIVEATGEARSRRGPDTGIVFREIQEQHRTAIADYISGVLMD